jgi:phenylacetate-CoA ligase
LPELAVIVPCFNEEFNLTELSERVLRVFATGGFTGELILVDDGSSDGTRAVIETLMAAHPDVVVGRFHPVNRGIAQAWKTGCGAARAHFVAVIDADLQYQPEDLLRLRRELRETSVDIVQGKRSSVGRAKDSRYYYSRGLNKLLNATFGMDLEDNKSGFVMCAREVFEDLLTYTGSYFYWQSFIMVAAHAKGYSYKEVETLFESRRQGQSFLENTALRAVTRSFVDLPKAAWEYRLSKSFHDAGLQFTRRHPVVDRSKSRSPARDLLWRGYMATFPQSHWMLSRDVEKYYEVLRKTQWLAPREMRQLQDEKLRRLIRHAYRNVPYYRGRMQELKLRPEDIRGQEDLHKLPLLTKADVRKHLYFDILSDNHDKRDVLRISTSGSTGEPFVIYADRTQLEFRWAATLRSQEWTGYEFGDPCVRLWHQTLGMSKSQVFKEKLDAAFCRRKFVPVFDMREDKLEEMVREISAWKPVLMDGYAEALDFLARYIKSKGSIEVHCKALMSSAQTLPEGSRKVIEEAFRCRVFDKYGSREFSGLAYECDAHNGHHVVGEGYIIEVLRDGRPVAPGELGEIVITDLNNFCLPFVRYRIGDLGVAMDANATCACGRGLPMLGNIEGRVQSIIQGTDGQFLPGTFFAHYLKEFDHALQKFQVVQEQPGAIVFKVVKGGRYSEAVLDEVLTTFRHHLGKNMKIDVEFVENVEMVRTGKRLASVSKLAVDFQKSSSVPLRPVMGAKGSS